MFEIINTFGKKEKFDFSTAEGQEKFNSLPINKQKYLVEEAHKEAIVLNKIKDEVILLSKMPGSSPEERKQIENKVMDISVDKNIVLHGTSIANLVSILQYGLLSAKELFRAEMTDEESNDYRGLKYDQTMGDEASLHFGQHLISTYFNDSGAIKSALAIDEYINLVYDFEEIKDKFIGFKHHQSEEVTKEPLKGLWHGEYMIDSQIETKFLKGLSVNENMFNKKLTLLLEEFEEHNKKMESYFNQSSPPYRPEQTIRLKNMILMVCDVLGKDVTLKELLLLWAKKLKIPIYLIKTKDVEKPSNERLFDSYQVVLP